MGCEKIPNSLTDWWPGQFYIGVSDAAADHMTSEPAIKMVFAESVYQALRSSFMTCMGVPEGACPIAIRGHNIEGRPTTLSLKTHKNT